MNKHILSLLFVAIQFIANAQHKYWVHFTDKNINDYNPYLHLTKNCIDNRLAQGLDIIQISDIPVSDAYMKECIRAGINIKQVSKWLNGFSANLTPEQILILKNFSFIKDVTRIDSKLYTAQNEQIHKRKEFSKALSLMEFEAFRNKGLRGENITIGVIDAGFYNLDVAKYAKHLYTKSRILGIRDFLEPLHVQNFYNNLTGGDSHGREVTKLIAGKTKKEIFGFATESKFYLARTEHAKKEMRVEEDSWVKAIEWMDSLGVRLINTSLGYSTGFDNPLENYRLEDMNGSTTIIAKAAKIATEQKGMFIVVSAGNEGNKANWKIISSPADVQGVLSVGATMFDRSKAGYSSIGPEYLSYQKPNLSAPALNGTSFSAPLVTGFVACIMQLKPSLKASEIKSIIEKSAHLYPYGNNYVGYGIPKATRVLSIISGDSSSTHKYISTKDSVVILDSINFSPKKRTIKNDKLTNNNVSLNDQTTSKIIIYHKRSDFVVDSMQVIENYSPQLRINKLNGTKFCTVDFGQRVLEIAWLKN